MTFNKKVKKGFYYLTSSWEFRWISTEKEAKAKNPVKYWRVGNFEELDAALEEAGAIHCETENVKVSKIPIILS